MKREYIRWLSTYVIFSKTQQNICPNTSISIIETLHLPQTFSCRSKKEPGQSEATKVLFWVNQILYIYHAAYVLTPSFVLLV